MATHTVGGSRLREFRRRYGTGGVSGVKVGILKTSRYQDGTPTAMVGAWNEFGTRLRSGKVLSPERPWFRNVMKNRRARRLFLEKMAEGVDPVRGVLTRQGAERLGQFVVARLKLSIVKLRTPANALRTIRMKGSSNPLIDTGHMRQSVSHQVIDGRSPRL